jgi:hypothetical protein
MTVEFVAGEMKELNVQLIPLGVVSIDMFPYFVAQQGWPAAGSAEVRIYVDFTNNGLSPVPLTCTSYLWPELMKDHPPASRSETFTIEAGATYKYREDFSSNYGWVADSWVEVEMPDGQLLTLPTITSICGYSLSSSDPPELVATEVGIDHAVLRYAQTSSCSIWRFRLHTPIYDPYEQSIRFECRSNESNRSIYAYVEDLLPSRAYRADCSGGPTAWRDAETQFTTL